MKSIDRLLKRARPSERAVTDDELMSAIKAGSKEAYLSLYDRYEGPVFAYCRRVLDDHDRAADVFQETFVRVWDRRASYHGGNFEAWIFTIVRNLCRDDFNRRVRFSQLNNEAEQLAAEEELNAIDRATIAEALAKLPEDQREAIVLREYEGFSYQDIAELTGQSLSSVGVRIFRAKQHLRILLAQYKDERP